jgi:hypothetical protein
MSFQYKYCKYKNKYLKLRGLGVQIGGSVGRVEQIDNISMVSKFLSPLDDNKLFTTIKIQFNCDDKKIHIIKITFKDEKDEYKYNENTPVLFALGGISHKSFVGTSTVILSKLNLLKKKFKEIYLIEYSDFGKMQDLACTERDDIKSKNNDNYHKIYEPELDMNNTIADYLNDIIINELRITNVHLLGKCNGAWVVSLLLEKHEQYKGLYLAVPGIPFDVQNLNIIDNARLSKINFVFGWVQQDAFKFHWNRKSYEEKNIYESTMRIIQKDKKIKLKYKSKMYNYDTELVEDSKNYHEIFPTMIDDIVNSIQ